MRKLAAIVLLSIFTFNMVGYQLLYNYMASRADAALEIALDAADYNDAELISIKQATHLPYYNNNASFQRIDGEVTIEGVHYKYVKCRIYNDSLEMLCIPNKQKMKLEASKNEYAKVAHDFQQNDTKKKAGESNKSPQKQLSEFEAEQILTLFAAASLIVAPRNSQYVTMSSIGFYSTDEQPPDYSPLS